MIIFNIIIFTKIPEKILPPAIPHVAVEDIPANNKAMAKIKAALSPKIGLNNSVACAKSSTCKLLVKIHWLQ